MYINRMEESLELKERIGKHLKTLAASIIPNPLKSKQKIKCDKT